MEKIYLTILEKNEDVTVSLSILSNTTKDIVVTNELISLIQIDHISAFDMLTIIHKFRMVINDVCDSQDNLVVKSESKLIDSLSKHFGSKFNKLEFQDVFCFTKDNRNLYVKRAIDLFFE